MDSNTPSPKVVPLKPVTRHANLLVTLRSNALQVLPPMLADVLGRVDDTLFDLVQRSSSSFEQQQFFDAMRELRRQRSSVESRYREHFGAAFSGIEKRAPVVAQYAQLGDTESELSLLDEAELEEQLASEQVAQAIERRHASVLGHLDRQLSQVTGIKIDGTVNPIGPGHVAAALRAALRGCELSSSSRLVLFKLYEQTVLPGLGAYYSEQQRLMAAAGLGSAPLLRHPVGRGSMPESASDRLRNQEQESERHTGAGNVQGGGGYGVAGGHGFHGGQGQGDGSPVRDDLFAALHGLLHDYRMNQRAGDPVAAAVPARADVPPLAVEHTLSVLSLLQRELPSSVQAAIDDPKLSLAGQLKRELMAQAERMGLGEPGAALMPPDEDAIDLVGMLFEVLLAERKFQNDVRGLFTRLIVPFTKVAMIDRRMFMQKTHPARRMLNAVAEACDGNQGETALEREMLGRVEGMVDRLVAEFNEDIAIFEALQEEFVSFLDQHRKRAELAERRAAEAQRGRERLEQARAVALMELAMMMGARGAPPLIDGFLRRYWTHHLAVVILRDGAESERFAQAREQGLNVWNQMLACEQGARRTDALGPVMEPVLGSSGLTGVPATEFVASVEALLDAMGAGDRDRVEALQAVNLPIADALAPVAPSAGDVGNVVQILAARGGVGAILAATSESAAAAHKDEGGIEPEAVGDDPAAHGDAPQPDAGDVERIRKLQVGSWVEMIGDDGSVQPAKLSWISPISSRLLFVNRRGVRVCASSAEELAVLLKLGKLSMRGIDTAFERAMTQVLGKLRESKAPPPAAGGADPAAT